MITAHKSHKIPVIVSDDREDRHGTVFFGTLLKQNNGLHAAMPPTPRTTCWGELSSLACGPKLQVQLPSCKQSVCSHVASTNHVAASRVAGPGQMDARARGSARWRRSVHRDLRQCVRIDAQRLSLRSRWGAHAIVIPAPLCLEHIGVGSRTVSTPNARLGERRRGVIGGREQPFNQGVRGRRKRQR